MTRTTMATSTSMRTTSTTGIIEKEAANERRPDQPNYRPGGTQRAVGHLRCGVSRRSVVLLMKAARQGLSSSFVVWLSWAGADNRPVIWAALSQIPCGSRWVQTNIRLKRGQCEKNLKWQSSFISGSNSQNCFNVQWIFTQSLNKLSISLVF